MTGKNEGRKERKEGWKEGNVLLIMHSTQVIYGYMPSDIYRQRQREREREREKEPERQRYR